MRYRPMGSAPDDPRLGRLVPDDFEHVERYPLSALRLSTPATVEKTLDLPSWHWTHDQGHEGSCVGHGSAMERGITNTMQRRSQSLVPYTQRYDPLWIWDRAKERDEWPDTNPGDDNGTSVRAGYDAIRELGVPKVYSMRLDASGDPYPVGEQPPDVNAGVSTNRWATTVDEMRSCINSGIPVVIGINWYTSFDAPTLGSYNHYWMATAGKPLGTIRGGHCVCIYAASDRLAAFKVKNSWGRNYPLAWLPYGAMGRLLAEDGEACMTTDR